MDAGISDGKPHGILALALAHLTEAGFTNSQAIATATSIAADTCGLGSSKDRLTAGYDADLLVVNGDPLQDISDLTNVQAVFVRGAPINVG